jgi:hypothetical protein
MPILIVTRALETIEHDLICRSAASPRPELLLFTKKPIWPNLVETTIFELGSFAPSHTRRPLEGRCTSGGAFGNAHTSYKISN